MPPLRIGFLAGALGGEHGWARLSLETMRHLAALGVECRVVATASETCNQEDDLLVDARPLLPAWPSGHLRWPISILRCLPAVAGELADCDLVHCLMEPYLPIAALASRIRARPLMVTAVGTYSIRTLEYGPRISPFVFWSRRAERIVCISRYTEKRLRARAAGAPTVVVNPGVDPGRFCPGEPLGPARSVEGRVILTAGAVKPRKGYDVVIEALARLAPHLSDAGLYIVGSEDSHRTYAARLRQLANRLGVAERVHFLGTISEEDLIDWYRRADVFILNTSNRGDHFEGFGLVLLEANGCGTPVIACHDSGAEDIVVPGENGLLVSQEDPGETARALESLLEQPERARAMGEAGRRRAIEMSWEKSARSLIDVYRDVLAGRRGAESSSTTLPEQI